MINIQFTYNKNNYTVYIDDECKIFLAKNCKKDNKVDENKLNDILKEICINIANANNANTACTVYAIKNIDNNYSIQYRHENCSLLKPLDNIIVTEETAKKTLTIEKCFTDVNNLNQLLEDFSKQLPDIPFSVEKINSMQEYSDEKVLAILKEQLIVKEINNQSAKEIVNQPAKEIVNQINGERIARKISDEIDPLITLSNEIKTVLKNIKNNNIADKQIDEKLDAADKQVDEKSEAADKQVDEKSEAADKQIDEKSEAADKQIDEKLDAADIERRNINRKIEKQKLIINNYIHAIKNSTESLYIDYEKSIHELALLKFKLAKSVYLGIARYINTLNNPNDKIKGLSEKFGLLNIFDEKGKLLNFDVLYNVFSQQPIEEIQKNINIILLACFNAPNWTSGDSISYTLLSNQLKSDFPLQSELKLGLNKKATANNYRENFNLKLSNHNINLAQKIEENKNNIINAFFDEKNEIGMALNGLKGKESSLGNSCTPIKDISDRLVKLQTKVSDIKKEAEKHLSEEQKIQQKKQDKINKKIELKNNIKKNKQTIKESEILKNLLHDENKILIERLEKNLTEHNNEIERATNENKNLKAQIKEQDQTIAEQAAQIVPQTLAASTKEVKRLDRQKAAIFSFVLFSLVLAIATASIFFTGGLTSPFVAFLLAKAFIIGSAVTSSALGAGVIGGLSLYTIGAVTALVFGAVFNEITKFFKRLCGKSEQYLKTTEITEFKQKGVEKEQIKDIANEQRKNQGKNQKQILNNLGGYNPVKRKETSSANNLVEEKYELQFKNNEKNVTSNVEITVENQKYTPIMSYSSSPDN